MSNTEYKETAINSVNEPEGEFKVLEEPLRPPVNEFKRFVRVFFRRKIVIIGFVLVVINILMAIFANVISPYDPYTQDYYNVLAEPSAQHILGTDALGRDVLSRVLYGSRVAISVGVISVLVSAAIGTLIGLVAGYAEGWVQALIMRITDALMAIPSLILQLLVAAVLNRGVVGVVIAVSVTLFPGYIRLVCGQVMSLKQNDYIMAERSMGAKTGRVLFKHLLPNCLSPLIVQMTMMMGVAILSEASLSFLNLGILPPTAAWGGMCYDGYKYLLTRPLLSIIPGLAIMILVFSFNMVGDGLRDALDPKMRGSLD
jgi:peptide/nickel transport system permease protein